MFNGQLGVSENCSPLRRSLHRSARARNETGIGRPVKIRMSRAEVVLLSGKFNGY